MLLNKSDIAQTEITKIIEAMGLITDMCLQLSINLSSKLLNYYYLNVQYYYNFFLCKVYLV